MSKETGGPAFPTENERQTGANSYHYEGMTLRDYFAAKALTVIYMDADDDEHAAQRAYELADAMLKAREQ